MLKHFPFSIWVDGTEKNLLCTRGFTYKNILSDLWSRIWNTNMNMRSMKKGKGKEKENVIFATSPVSGEDSDDKQQQHASFPSVNTRNASSKYDFVKVVISYLVFIYLHKNWNFSSFQIWVCFLLSLLNHPINYLPFQNSFWVLCL